jgi:hypothetical protein
MDMGEKGLQRLEEYQRLKRIKQQDKEMLEIKE